VPSGPGRQGPHGRSRRGTGRASWSALGLATAGVLCGGASVLMSRVSDLRAGAPARYATAPGVDGFVVGNALVVLAAVLVLAAILVALLGPVRSALTGRSRGHDDD